MEKKNNGLKILVIGLLSVGFILIGVAILLSFKKEEEKPKKDPVPSKKYASLVELAKELYDSESYKSLPTDEEKGVYYLTLDEFKKKGYNQDIIDTSCPGDVRVLNFTMSETEQFNRFYIIDNCNNLNDDPNAVPEKRLIDIANELYENNEYLNLTQGEGGYYMTIGMYKSRGYDTKLINPECSDDSGVLFFDINNKEKYEGNPVFSVYECNQPK